MKGCRLLRTQTPAASRREAGGRITNVYVRKRPRSVRLPIQSLSIRSLPRRTTASSHSLTAANDTLLLPEVDAGATINLSQIQNSSAQIFLIGESDDAGWSLPEPAQ